MIRLPGGIGDKEELVLMRPFTPSGQQKHNMVSWLAVRNSYDNYGEMILFNFPKNTNIFGPYQVEVKINQIDKISRDMTLWGQSGSDVYKGSLLVIPIENSALSNMFDQAVPTPETDEEAAAEEKQAADVNEEVLNQLTNKLNDIRKRLEELEDLINRLNPTQ